MVCMDGSASPGLCVSTLRKVSSVVAGLWWEVFMIDGGEEEEVKVVELYQIWFLKSFFSLLFVFPSYFLLSFSFVIP